VTPFDLAAVRALGLPDTTERSEALARAAATELPTAEEEVWRYSRIGELRLDAYRPALASTTVDGPVEFVVDDAPPLEDLDRDVFDHLNAAFHRQVSLSVPRRVAVGRPIVITHTVDADATAVFPRLVIDVGTDAEVTVVERFLSTDGVAALVVPRVYVRAAPAARVTYLAINQLGRQAWQIAHQHAAGKADSSMLLANVALGGDYARVRTEVRAEGAGAGTRQIAVYFADGDQMHDFRTTQAHAAPHTTSDLLFKGAVKDTAKSVYTGLIKIRPEAKGSVAFQTNRNLTLSEGAWAESVPNLEIETNDVKCSHASSIGPIDDEQRFYLESRGIDPEVAERLVVLGFFDEVLDQLPVGVLAGELRAAVAAKLTAEVAVGVG
jgi:Fe-S cluster assembly protein SufD